MPERFKMVVANIYSLPRGPVVTGRIEAARVSIGDSLILIGKQGGFPVKVTSIERFQETLETADEGSGLVGLTLAGISHDQIHNRDILIG